MKKLVVFVACLLPLSIMAQKEFKFGHVNVQEIFATMPETEEMRSQLEKSAKEYEAEIEKMMEEYSAKADAFSKDMKDMSEEIQRNRYSEIQNLEQRITLFRQNASESLQTKQQELTADISEKILNAIKVVGKENNFTYIFNLGGMGSATDVLYASEQSTDATAMVKKKLAEKAPATKK